MIIVTGGDGFIGSNLIKRLSAFSDRVLSVDYSNHRKNREWIHSNDFLFAEEYLNKADVVFHNGAASSTTNRDPFDVMHKNFDYSVELLKRCLKYNIKLIYASSASVYGDGPFYESSPKNPKNMYALSKSMFDDYSALFSEHLPQLTGLRYFNVYGRGEEYKKNMASVVYKFYHQHQQTGEVILFENSEHFLRDFVHIDDVLDITVDFYENGHSGIYNVGSGLERSFADIANIFVDRYGSKIKVVPMPEELHGKYQKYTKSDNTRINQVCDSKRLTLEQGVHRYLDYLESK